MQHVGEGECCGAGEVRGQCVDQAAPARTDHADRDSLVGVVSGLVVLPRSDADYSGWHWYVRHVDDAGVICATDDWVFRASGKTGLVLRHLLSCQDRYPDFPYTPSEPP